MMPLEINPALWGPAAVAVVATLVAALAWVRLRAVRERAAEMGNDAQLELADVRRQLEESRRLMIDWRGEKTAAEVRLEEAEKRLALLTAERDHTRAERDVAVAAFGEAEKRSASLAQEVVHMRQRMEDWDKARAESLQAARAAVMTTAAELSTKLLDDHKREAEIAKKEGEDRVRKATENLFNQFQDITRTVAALHGQVTDQKATLQTVWKALTVPTGAGNYAEVGLENTLKSFSLERHRDYVVQQAIEGSRLRPDAMVFLPNGTVLVVDSKASKFLLDLAQAEDDGEDLETIYQDLARSMNAHLKALADKDYGAEVKAAYREAGKGEEVRRVINLMYLPNEGAIEKLGRADPEFSRKAAKLGITTVGPTALACLIGYARLEIDLGRQAENQERIVELSRTLMDRVATVLDKAAKMGRGLRTANDNFADMVGSINSRLLPTLRAMESQGVRPAGSKGIPKPLPHYQVVMVEDAGLIEAESEPEADGLPPPPLALTDGSGDGE